MTTGKPKFIELDRDFVSLDAARRYGLDDLDMLGLLGSKSLKWLDLLERKRVVVLAGAESGKTQEFRERVSALRKAGSFAQFLTIERLASDGVELSLNITERAQFAAWQASDAPGWFFLDSVDEARINHRDIDTALNRFAIALDAGYDRARVLLSCRGSAWEGTADLERFTQTLPVTAYHVVPVPAEPEEALFAKPKDNGNSYVVDEGEHDAGGINDQVLVVAMSSLSAAQRTLFVSRLQNVEPGPFLGDVVKHGLERYADRPGDLRALALYWGRHGKFGSLTEMTEFAISERLIEHDRKREAARLVTDVDARAGVERLAAAMTLAKTMELVLPTDEADTGDGVDPYAVLADWKPDDVTGLLHRGVFAPATFCRLRFYHRSAQEYLAACWFLKLDLPDSELYAIFLAEVYGISTVPPSLRATAAWIAGKHAGLRDHLLEREPLVLLADGDPGSLSIPDRAELLDTFAEQQSKGQSPYRVIDHRSLWMFADPALAESINAALKTNRRPEFQLEMVQIVELGAIAGCRDAMRRIAHDASGNPYLRLSAVSALGIIGDDAGLAEVAVRFKADPGPLDRRLAPAFALALFPEHLTVAEVLTIVMRTRPARRYQVEGFRHELATIFDSCPLLADQETLVDGLAALAFEPPLGDWPPVSKRYATLVEQLGPLVRAAILAFDGKPPRPGLITLIRAVMMEGEDRHEGTTLASLVAARPTLKRAVFLADIAAEVAAEKCPVRHIGQLGSFGHLAWTVNDGDAVWLEDLLASGQESERLVALDALYRLSRQDGSVIDLDALARRIAGDAELPAVLAEARKPFEPTPKMLKHESRMAETKLQMERRQTAARDELLAFRDGLQADPGQLHDEAKLSEWPGAHPLARLTEWLRGQKFGSGYDGAALQWHKLSPAFGDDVATAYRNGMTRLWRLVPSEHPKIDGQGHHSRYDVVLSFAGIGIEAAENRDWADALRPDEVVRAAEHACRDGQSIPAWLDNLLQRHPEQVAPIVLAEMSNEWKRSHNHTPFLERAAQRMALGTRLQHGLTELISGPAPRDVARISTAAEIVGRLDLTRQEQSALLRVSGSRIASFRKRGDWISIGPYVRLRFRLDPTAGVATLEGLLDHLEAGKHWDEAFSLMRSLFDRHRGSVVDPEVLGPDVLARLAERTYLLEERTTKAPAGGEGDDDSSFDIHDPREALLSSLVRLDGEQAYYAVVRLAERPVIARIAHHIRERARQVAERAADRPNWTEAQVLAFETRKLAPISTGSDLLMLVCSLLDTLDWEFRKADMSERAVVETAKDEEAVQEWLGTTLARMGGGRFRCDRETQVAANRRPDITVTATQVQVQVAIEIKHDEKGWTMPNLRFALATQLSERYLYPANRRHGVLVITNHRDSKFWRELRSGERITFGKAIERLQAQAARITSNSTGPIDVAVRGLDASPGRRQVAKAKNSRRSSATITAAAALKTRRAVARPASKKPKV